MLLTEASVKALLIAAANYRMKYRSWLLDAFTISNTYTHTANIDRAVPVGDTLAISKGSTDEKVVLGDVIQCKYDTGFCAGIVIDGAYEDAHAWTILILSDGTTPVWGLTDVFEVAAGTAAEILGKHPIIESAWGMTSVGRFLVNIAILQYPFDFNVFPYVNKHLSPSKIENLVKTELLAGKITVPEFEKFWDYLYFIGHLADLVVPSMTVKSLMTSDKVPEIKRKFIEENKDKMNDPLVIQKLEDALIKADKEYLGDDPSTVFFDGLGSKAYGLHRKKLFLTVGGIPAFSGDTSKMDFIPNSLSEGWIPEKLPSIASEIRKGSYSRGVETAKGGAETKLVWRAFGDITLVEDDCGTKRTIKIDCSFFDARQFIGRTINVDGMDIVLTPENVSKYAIGKVINLYSPLTCATKNNFCYKCCGQRAKELGARQLGVQTIKITSTFMQLSMKNMHGTTLTIQSNKLEDILL